MLPTDRPSTPAPGPGAGAPPARRPLRRIGIGGRLGLGMAVVGLVILFGHGLATRTTREAVESVREMQLRHEPLARHAEVVIEKLVAFDRAVSEYLKAERVPAESPVESAAAELDAAIAAYLAEAPQPSTAAAAAELRTSIAAHIEAGKQLAGRAAERTGWVRERRQRLEQLHRRIATAGGAGLALDEHQVFARRSLAELAAALAELRARSAPAAAAVAAERQLQAVLARYEEELQRSPGSAWLHLVREDLAAAIRLRRAIDRFDAAYGPARREFLDAGARLMSTAQSELQEPARRALTGAAERAAVSAVGAERTLAATGATVFGVLLLVCALLIYSITVPVRRLTRATRQLAAGDRRARAPRGGSAEIDALAESFNAMADQIVAVEGELRAHQAELEQHVAERTRQLHHLAHHDPLTQLPNRRQLTGRLAETLARAEAAGHRAALLFVDLDNFKSINDTLGHAFGDRVLQAITARLRSACGPGTFLARLGGDEFTVLIEDVRAPQAVEAQAAAILSALARPLSVDDRALSTGASIGASLFPDHARDADALLRAADVALFRAKELGRSRFTLYSPELYDAAAHRFRLEQSLRRAVQAGDLLLMFQPQVSLQTLETTSLEALLRWRRPGGRIATATEFIHIAEKTGLIDELTDWVLRSATSTAAAWRAQGWHRACLAINVSPPQLLDTGFVDRVIGALEVTGLPPSALELELTETVFQTGRVTIDALRRLREHGVAIALDDFGIGYSSLTSLEQLPISRVKLDRMLVEAVDSSQRSAAIARSIIALCQGLGLQVIAEGVERPAQLEFLAGCGPVGVQGYLLCLPVEAQQASEAAHAAAARTRELLAEIHGAPAHDEPALSGVKLRSRHR